MKIGILLTNEHRLLSVAAILDVFQTVNSFYNENGHADFFDIELMLENEKYAMAYPGLQLASPKNKGQYDLLFIPAFKPEAPALLLANNREWISWIQEQYTNGAAIASFCTGAFLLAATGLLDHKPATTHINAEYAFANAFPKVLVQSEAVVTEKDGIFTSGGATNSFHLMIYLIEKYCNREMAVRTAKIFSVDIDRKQQTYFGTFLPIEDHGDSLVKQAQLEIKKNFRDANTIEEIIVDVPSSRRNLVRRFKQATGITPIEYLQKTRIEAAKQLLEQSRQSILEVMLDSGYNDLKSFRSLFKKNVGMTPTAYRDKFSPFSA
jgi:transcriptional regulator GlxA family with amidase domain